MSVTITLTHEGVDYAGEIMTIRSTTFGSEDHGITSAYLNCEAPGTGVSLGGYALDSWEESEKRRIGTAFGLDHLMQMIQTVGVSSWEKLPGQQIIVLGGGLGRIAKGFASLDGTRVLLFKDHADEWTASSDRNSVNA